MKKLWYKISLLGVIFGLMLVLSTCKSARQDQATNKGTVESSGTTTTSEGIVTPGSEKNDSTKATGIKHSGPNQTRIDSIKKAKTDKKRRK